MGDGHSPGPTNDLGEPIVVDDGTLPRTQLPAPDAIGFDAKGGNAKGSQASMADRIVGYARRRMSNRVGDGECFALVHRALRSAGAKSARDYGDVTPDADYVWGRAINRSELRRGDIIQFRNYELEVETTTSLSDGDEIQTRTASRPHHTAIVERVGSGGAVTVLEQNIPPGTGGVARATLFFANGTTEDGNVTRRVQVRGSFWFYRPEAR